MTSEHDESPVSVVQWLQVTARSKRLPLPNLITMSESNNRVKDRE